MKHNWEYKPLYSVGSIDFGKRIVAKETEPGPYFVYGGGGATFTTKDYNRKDCTIVSRFAMSANCVRHVKGKFFLNDSGLSVKSKDKALTQNFLDKFLFSIQPIIYNLGRGAAQKNLNVKDFAAITVPVPPLSEQLHVAAELDRINEAIAAKEAQLKELDNLVKSQFIEMFGDLQASAPLSDFIESSFSGEWGNEDDNHEGVKVLRTTNFNNDGTLSFDKVVTRLIPESKILKKHLQKGDIILEKSGGTNENPVGRVVYFNEDGLYLFNNFTMALRCKPKYDSLFVFYSLYYFYQLNKEEIRNMSSKTTGIANLKMERYWKIPIKLADLNIQKRFADIVHQTDRSKDIVRRQVEELRTLLAARMDYWFND